MKDIDNRTIESVRKRFDIKKEAKQLTSVDNVVIHEALIGEYSMKRTKLKSGTLYKVSLCMGVNNG